MEQPQASLKSRVHTVTAKPSVKKKNQLGYGIALLAAIILFGVFLSNIKAPLAIRWMLGIALGFVLQRSRFCFTAATRDPFLTGSTSLLRAVLIAIMIATVGFAAIQYNAFSAGKPVPGNISPVGIHTIIGGIIFGIGAVIAGGCASGTLMRVGEAYIMNMIALVFFIAGSALGAYHFGWWKANVIKNAPSIFLPNVLGWPLAFFGQLVLLFALYWLALWWDYRKAE
ncbi:YeeE/YedE thiosulfate transporter family protein [Thermovenabulum gondwanense]|uniref:Uncharacterized protein n=1 Tax=Thermovenabulum gondwanense TaxID=520767 RepID=A0A162MUD0_9FIRM|nr:YeeE/YedE thiosulfate transporter family protein [Thermovenabulum gondwanense]KYO67362.1 hypothetical protein ATZ99_06480 [Thermovenabulum gondwanense]